MNIRLILLIIGAVIVLAIILDGMWRRKRNQEITRQINQQKPEIETRIEPEFHSEPTLEPIVDVQTDLIFEPQSIPTLPATVTPDPVRQDIAEEELEEATVQFEPETGALVEEIQETPMDDFVVLTVMAKPGRFFSGFDLLQVLLKAGLKHGVMDIFHRHRDLDNKSPIYFSVASVTKPGTFDIRNMNKCETKGLSIFMSVPDSQDAEDVFGIMLSTAQQLAHKLGGVVCDRQRKPLDNSAIAECRSRVRISGDINQQYKDLRNNDSE